MLGKYSTSKSLDVTLMTIKCPHHMAFGAIAGVVGIVPPSPPGTWYDKCSRTTKSTELACSLQIQTGQLPWDSDCDNPRATKEETLEP